MALNVLDIELRDRVFKSLPVEIFGGSFLPHLRRKELGLLAR